MFATLLSTAAAAARVKGRAFQILTCRLQEHGPGNAVNMNVGTTFDERGRLHVTSPAYCCTGRTG